MIVSGRGCKTNDEHLILGGIVVESEEKVDEYLVVIVQESTKESVSYLGEDMQDQKRASSSHRR